MSIKHTTPVPNYLFDQLLSSVSPSELKVLLVVVRQTLGFIDPHQRGKRKTIDRLSIGFICKKTGCSRRAVSTALESLTQNEYIIVFDKDKNRLKSALERKGKTKLYFQFNSQAVDYPPKYSIPKQQFHRIRANIAHNPEHYLPTTKTISINQIIKRNYSLNPNPKKPN